MAIGRGAVTLRSVRNLSLFQFAIAMVLMVISVISVSLHGTPRTGVPVYYSGAFVALPLSVTIAGLSLGICIRAKQCSNKMEVVLKMECLMKAYCLFLVMSWLGWFVSMMLTGITGVCRSSSCSYTDKEAVHFSLAITMLICIGLAFFANVLCTMFLYVYASEMGLTIFGTKRIKVGDANQPNGAHHGMFTATTESQTLPSLTMLTATAQCQTTPAFSVHDSFQPYNDSNSPRPVSMETEESPVLAYTPENVPSEQDIRDLVQKYHTNKKRNKKKRHKENVYKQFERKHFQDLDSTLPTLSEHIYSPSSVHLESMRGLDPPYSPPSSPPPLSFYGHRPHSPRSIPSPDYLHVQLPNAPSPSPSSQDNDEHFSYQVSYLPINEARRSSTATPGLSIRIPTATPTQSPTTGQYSPPSPTFIATAWQGSISSLSTSPPRCVTPRPSSSFSSTSPPLFLGGGSDKPSLLARYNPTPPPGSASPKAYGTLFEDTFDDDSPPFSP